MRLNCGHMMGELRYIKVHQRASIRNRACAHEIFRSFSSEKHGFYAHTFFSDVAVNTIYTQLVYIWGILVFKIIWAWENTHSCVLNTGEEKKGMKKTHSENARPFLNYVIIFPVVDSFLGTWLQFCDTHMAPAIFFECRFFVHLAK